MAMPAEEERVELYVGEGDAARVHGDWLRYEVDSDLLVPADGWSMSLAMKQSRVPAIVRAGAAVRLALGSDTLMTGRIDEVSGRTSKQGTTLSITGRDGAGVLLDASAPIFGEQNLTLAEVIAKAVRPLGVTRIDISAENAQRREKVLVQPGESAWQALTTAAEANGLAAWFTPDGTLVVGGPDYTTPVVATLVHRLPESPANNVIDIELRDSLSKSFSEVTVLGQCHGGGETRRASNVRGTWRDPSVPYHRPKIVIDHEVENQKQAEERARKLVMDSRLERWTCRVTVRGHRIDAPGIPGHGRPWAPGMRVALIDDAYGLDGVFFLMARRFQRSREGVKTVLTLKEDGAWIVAAHPHKRRRRRQGEGTGAKVWDISNQPQPEAVK